MPLSQCGTPWEKDRLINQKNGNNHNSILQLKARRSEDSLEDLILWKSITPTPNTHRALTELTLFTKPAWQSREGASELYE